MNRIKGRNISAKIDFRTITELHLSVGDSFKYSTMFDRFFISCKLFHFKIVRKNAIGIKFGIHIMEPALHSTMMDIKMGALNNQKRLHQTLGYQVLWNWSLIFRKTFIMVQTWTLVYDYIQDIKGHSTSHLKKATVYPLGFHIFCHSENKKSSELIVLKITLA